MHALLPVAVFAFTTACQSKTVPTDPTINTDSAPVDTNTDDTAELRGIWITRFSWSTQAELETIFDDVAAAGFNAVFFQVRGNFDAYYKSDREPWAEKLTGTLGQDPGWDPLLVAVEKTREHDLELHAYINAFPFWRGETAPDSVGLTHPYTDHPEWLVADTSGTPMALNESYVFASPGNQEVRGHIARIAEEIRRDYVVQGVHLDYIRYPGPTYSYDAVSEEEFVASGLMASERDHWQRLNINKTIAGVHSNLDVPVTAAVWGIYENIWGWEGVSQGNIDYFQDTEMFMENGNLDAFIPMIYWPVAETEGDRLDFRVLVRDHLTRANGRHVYAGMGGESITTDQLIECVKVAREEGANGVVVFDYSLFSDDLSRLKTEVFSEPAEVPDMPWRTAD